VFTEEEVEHIRGYANQIIPPNQSEEVEEKEKL